MNTTKIIIQIRDGVVGAIYSNTTLHYTLIDHDLTNLSKNPVHAPAEPDYVYPVLYELLTAIHLKG